MDLSEVIVSERIKLNLEATNKKEVIEELVGLLYDSGVLLEKESFIKDVYLREDEGFTGIGNFIAIPHGKSKFVKDTSLALGRTKQEIQWETLDGMNVKFIILFAVNDEDRSSTHLRLLSKVAGKLAKEEVCTQLLEATSTQEVLDIFLED